MHSNTEVVVNYIAYSSSRHLSDLSCIHKMIEDLIDRTAVTVANTAPASLWQGLEISVFQTCTPFDSDLKYPN